jgi:hypothetical protein
MNLIETEMEKIIKNEEESNAPHYITQLIQFSGLLNMKLLPFVF